jgi:hypothetical protein
MQNKGMATPTAGERIQTPISELQLMNQREVIYIARRGAAQLHGMHGDYIENLQHGVQL